MNRTLLIVGAMLALGLSMGAALAEDNGPDWVGSEIEAACDTSHNVCYAGCSGNTSEQLCLNKCDDIWLQCAGSFGMLNQGAAAQSTGGVLDPGPRQPQLFGMGFVNLGRLQNACRQVKGNFQRTESSHSCVNPACAGSDIVCVVVCADGNCSGGMPDKPSGPLTLLGILQNGDNIDRSAPSTSSGGGSAGGAGEDDPDEPECGIGGCGPIL